MQKRPTIRDVAEHAGVSKTTVGYVLSGNMSVAIPDITRARVCGAAKELGYRRNIIAQSFATGRSQNVGVVVSYQGYVNGYQDAFVSRILYGLQEICAQNRQGVLLAAAQDNPDSTIKQVESMLEQKVRGLVLVGRLPITDIMCILQEAALEHVQCIQVDDRNAADLVDCVISDDITGARIATKHLIDQGRKRIAHLSAGTQTSTARDREAGYRSALIEAGLDFEENITQRSSFSPSDALNAAEKLICQSTPPDAVFADSDYLAAAVLQVVSHRGLRVPDDVALVGYGDLQVAEWLDLTTIRQNPEDMGRHVAEALFSQRNKNKPCEIMLPVDLIQRGSCGARNR